jgi:glycosyltransferase involved in cell wall biosynthesis
MKTEVTILIPNLNGARYLSQALDSCLAQTYPCEIIVVDNGSKDESLRILHSYSSRFPRIKVMNCSEIGISAALNLGLTAINTDYICRLDADDFMEPDRVQIQQQYLRDHPDVQIVGSQVNYVDENGLRLGMSKYPSGIQEVKNAFALINPVAHPSVMIRKSAIIATQGYRSEFDGAEDFELWLRILEIGPINNLDYSLTNYRVHQSQESVKKNLYGVESKVRKKYAFRTAVSPSHSLRFKVEYLLRLVDLTLKSRNIDLHRKMLRKLKK